MSVETSTRDFQHLVQPSSLVLLGFKGKVHPFTSAISPSGFPLIDGHSRTVWPRGLGGGGST